MARVFSSWSVGVFLAAAVCRAVVAQDPVPVARWQLNETSGTMAADSSTNGYDGAIMGAPLLGRQGKLGTAFEFDGLDDHVIISGGVGISQHQARTICGWARANSTTQSDWTTVFGFSYTGSGASTFFDVEMNGSTPRQYVLHFYNYEPAFMTIDLSWHFFAATYYYNNDTDRQLLLYVDGVLVRTENTPPMLSDSSTTQIQIARRSNGHCFNGLVDDVRVYDRVLTAAEILAIYNEVPPSVQRVTADDADDADSVYGIGDTITLSFDTDMVQSTEVTGALSGSVMNTRFALNNVHTWGSSNPACNGAWTDARTLVLTVAGTSGATVAVNDIITIPSSVGLSSLNGVHQNVVFVCAPIKGNFGMPSWDALVLHYTLDETSGTVLHDSRYDTDATLVGVVWPDDSAAGVVDEAITFLGFTNYAYVTDPSIIQSLEEFTVMAWFQPNKTELQHAGTPIVKLAKLIPS